MRKKTLDDVYRLYMGDIYRYIISLCRDHYLAEDIMQETFYRAYMYLEDCPKDRVKPWLFKVAYNAFVDYKRKDNRVRPVEDNLLDAQAAAGSLEDEVIEREELSNMRRLIDMLPESQKQAIILCDFGALSYKEAADFMGISLSHFKVLLFRARQRIRENGRG
jgi:RNA polymerase sigma-70 factor (ECF subfamily)